MRNPTNYKPPPPQLCDLTTKWLSQQLPGMTPEQANTVAAAAVATLASVLPAVLRSIADQLPPTSTTNPA